MQMSKFLVSAVATSALVGAIGFTYAQNDKSSGSSTGNSNPAYDSSNTAGPTGDKAMTDSNSDAKNAAGTSDSAPSDAKGMSSDSGSERTAKADRN